jgi:hypothetical protein
MRPIIRAATFSALASISLGAGAEPVGGATRWLCIDTTETTLHCHVQQASGPTPATLFPDPLPRSVRSIREQPAAWRGRAVLIPLFSHAIDLAHARELAQAVLCGRQPFCSARLATSAADDPVDWLAFADAHDPLFTDPALDQDAP